MVFYRLCGNVCGDRAVVVGVADVGVEVEVEGRFRWGW